MAQSKKTFNHLMGNITMHYKGFTGVAEYQEDTLMYFGSVINIDDVITFMAASFADLPEEFHASVDDYLEFIKSLGDKK